MTFPVPVGRQTVHACRLVHMSMRPYSTALRRTQTKVNTSLRSKLPIHILTRSSSYGPGQGPDESSGASSEKKAKNESTRRVTIADLRKLYEENTKISMLTAHDAMSANACDRNNIDVVLIGDSLAMVALGYETTTAITLEEMFHHSRAVGRGSRRSFLVGDMPFGSYQASVDDAAKNAIRFIKEGNVQAVKFEGGEHIVPLIEKVVRCGVPVLGHIGLTPQSVNVLGGFKVQGKTCSSAQQLVRDALALQQAGCFAMVIEAVPSPIAEHITKILDIPTIGIGAGPHTSGQVLVQQDMLGVFDRFTPKFCRQYAQLASSMHDGLTQYIQDVKDNHQISPPNNP
eukprot:CFRG6847T1